PASTSRQAIMRLVSISNFAEISYNRQSRVARLLRVKLHSKQIAALDRSGECGSVCTFRNRGFDYRRPVAMSEVHKSARGNALEQTSAFTHLQLVPAHVRHLDSIGKT